MQLVSYGSLVCLFVLSFVVHCAIAFHCQGRPLEPCAVAPVLQVQITRYPGRSDQWSL